MRVEVAVERQDERHILGDFEIVGADLDPARAPIHILARKW